MTTYTVYKLPIGESTPIETHTNLDFRTAKAIAIEHISKGKDFHFVWRNQEFVLTEC